MTVSTAYSPITSPGNGTAAPISVTWPFFTGSLVVTEIDADGVETVKTLTTHYTVSGGTDANGLPAVGTVTPVSTRASGTSWRITRSTPKTQSVTWNESDGFPQKVVEAALDKLTLLNQEGGGGASPGIPGSALTLDTSEEVDFYDAGAYPVRSSATPSDDDDLINKAYGDANYGGAAADAAAASADAAALSAGNASTSATAASGSASTAGTQATNASDSAAAAAASALAAAANSSSPCFTVKWNTNTGASDPGSTYVKGNNGTLGSITTLYLSETVLEGAISGFLTAMFGGASAGSPAAFALIKPGSRTNYIAGTVTAHVDSGVYRTLTFSVGSANGTFAADDVLVMIITPAVTSTLSASALAAAAFGPFTTIASATTTDLSTVATVGVSISGTTTITGFGTGANLLRIGKFAGALTLTHNGTSLILPGGVNITTAAGDRFIAMSDGSGNWTVVAYVKANGYPILLPGVSGSPDSVVLKTAGKTTVWIPAAAMTARTTNGAASGTTELATNDVMLSTFDFDTTTEEGVGFWVAFPKSYNNGTVSFEGIWTAASGSGGIALGLAAYAFSDDDAMDTAVSGQQVVTDTLITANDLHKTAESSAITIGGTPAAGDVVYFELTREVANGSDTLGVDAKLIGIRLFFTENATNDA